MIGGRRLDEEMKILNVMYEDYVMHRLKARGLTDFDIAIHDAVCSIYGRKATASNDKVVITSKEIQKELAKTGWGHGDSSTDEW